MEANKINELHSLVKELLIELRSLGTENKDLLNKAQEVVEKHDRDSAALDNT